VKRRYIALGLIAIAGCKQDGKVPLKPANEKTVLAYISQLNDLQTQENKIQQQIQAELETKNQPIAEAIRKATPDLQQQLNGNLKEESARFKAQIAPLEAQKTATQQKLQTELLISKRFAKVPDTAIPASDDGGKTVYFQTKK
jgi:hypothetical protein